MRTLTTLLFAACAVAAAGAAAAQPPAQLPAFAVTRLDGHTAQSTSLASDGTWLLVYLEPKCPPCDELLDRAGRERRESLSRIVFVGGGMDANAVTELAAKHQNLGASVWVADPPRASAAALQVHASPGIYGLRGTAIEWRMAGSLHRRGALESVLFTWLEKR